MTLAPPKPKKSARPAGASPGGPPTYRWTLDEYHALDETDIFRDKRTELVAGKIYVMGQPDEIHTVPVMLAAKRLELAFPVGHVVRQEKPFIILPDTDVGPDLAVVAGDIRQTLATGRPTAAVLIVEVANTSLAYDTGEKAELYAKAGVEDYWVLDVNRRRLFVFRSPIVDADREHGHWYASVQIFDETQSAAPLAAPSGPASGPVAVADLLP